MAMSKKDALKANGIDEFYDVYADRYMLRRTKPAQTMQLAFYARDYEHYSVNDIWNMFDEHHRYQDDFVNLGPTNAELRDPRILHAWQELQIIRKLIGTI